MAKGGSDTAVRYREIMQDIKAGRFSPVYLLMGEEQYYINKVYGALMDNVLDEAEKDFNLTVFYGADVSGADIANAASRYPMRPISAVTSLLCGNAAIDLGRYSYAFLSCDMTEPKKGMTCFA